MTPCSQHSQGRLQIFPNTLDMPSRIGLNMCSATQHRFVRWLFVLYWHLPKLSQPQVMTKPEKINALEGAAMEDVKTDSVFAQVNLTAAPHAKNCEVLRLSEEKLWTCGVDGRMACSSFEGGRNRMFGIFWDILGY